MKTLLEHYCEVNKILQYFLCRQNEGFCKSPELHFVDRKMNKLPVIWSY